MVDSIAPDQLLAQRNTIFEIEDQTPVPSLLGSEGLVVMGGQNSAIQDSLDSDMVVVAAAHPSWLRTGPTSFSFVRICAFVLWYSCLPVEALRLNLVDMKTWFGNSRPLKFCSCDIYAVWMFRHNFNSRSLNSGSVNFSKASMAHRFLKYFAHALGITAWTARVSHLWLVALLGNAKLAEHKPHRTYNHRVI